MPAARAWTPPHHRLEQLALPLELARLRPDVVHSIDFIPAFWRRWRSVITVHDLGFWHFPETLTAESRRYYGQLGRAAQSADRIIAVSRSTRADLITLAGVDPAKIEVVLEAAGPEFQPVGRGAARARAGELLGVKRPFVLFVGSFEPRKNLVRLVEAFARVRQERDVELALVGRRAWLFEPIFRRINELELGEVVRVVEGLPHESYPVLYSAAELLAFPSLYEGFGLPPLEAMSCGCPVVSSNRASLPEVVGEAGLLVEPDDTQSLAEAVLKVLTDPALSAELRRRGLERARQFSWQRTAQETLAVYRRASQ
jgi:glycosyltransferase involved in cell wall biosynthesis